MNKFQAQFQTAYKNGEIPDFIHFYQMIDVLIIDDIQELTGKTGTQNAFFNIFNHLQLAGKQLILTSDKPPVELKDIEQRLLTRFKWGLSAQLNTPDYDTKLKIIRVKAQKFGAQISDDVVAYLADNISANVREIEGALSSLVANASFLGRKITTSLAKEILKVYVQLYQKEITLDHIIEVVCEYLNLDFARFNSTERTREIAQARQIAMYLAKQHTKAPLTTIGAAIGGRNHATVLHSCKAVSNLIETDKAFRRQVEEIERKCLRNNRLQGGFRREGVPPPRRRIAQSSPGPEQLRTHTVKSKQGAVTGFVTAFLYICGLGRRANPPPAKHPENSGSPPRAQPEKTSDHRMDQPKLERLLRLMKLLTANTTYNVDQLAERLQMSRRTIYRYIDTFREAGFVIKKRATASDSTRSPRTSATSRSSCISPKKRP